MAPPDGRYSGAGGAEKGWARFALSAIGRFVYPAQCAACREEVAETGGLCPTCWKETTFIAGPACRACGVPVIAGLGEDALCDACAHAPPAWSRGAAAVVYEGVGRKLVLSLKHADRLDIAPVAAGWMARAGARLLETADIVAPVPLHWRRMMKRRFNQSGELARALGAAADVRADVVEDLLTRSRATPSMDGMTRAERQKNVSDVFSVKRAYVRRASGARILLIDDVMTTGATLSACAEACRAAGAADVNVLVFARVARGDWPT